MIGWFARNCDGGSPNDSLGFNSSGSNGKQTDTGPVSTRPLCQDIYLGNLGVDRRNQREKFDQVVLSDAEIDGDRKTNNKGPLSSAGVVGCVAQRNEVHSAVC